MTLLLVILAIINLVLEEHPYKFLEEKDFIWFEPVPIPIHGLMKRSKVGGYQELHSEVSYLRTKMLK